MSAPPPSQRPFGDSKPSKKGFLVVVTGKLAPGQMPKFLEMFKPVAAHVAQHEEGCSSYEISVSADDADSFIIYERYTSRQYVEEVHFQSAPFAKLKEGLSSLEWVEPMKLSMFEELDVGF